MRQVAAMSSPVAESECRPTQLLEIDQRVGAGCGSENSQVPPASQAYPSRHCVIWSADERALHSVMVLRFMMLCSESGMD